ncbi:unnamed protein product, partial [Ectocarpus fasciculatus]
GDDLEKTIKCACYRDIACPYTKKIVSDACNQVSETHAKRTTYDQVFFFGTMIKDYLDVQNRTRPANKLKKAVSARELRACWAKVPGVTPSNQTLRNHLLISASFSTQAMASLKSMTEEKLMGVERISQTFLKTKEFTSLSDKPREQAMYLEIFARCPKASDGKIDKAAALAQASA